MKTIKPWGFFEKFTENETTTVKLITIKAGKRTSLQFHENRSEKWIVINGEGHAFTPEKKMIKTGDEVLIPKKTIHRLEATTELKVLEISYGEFNESDIKRIEDDYNRD